MKSPLNTGPHPADRHLPWMACAPFEKLLNMTVETAENGRAVLSMPFLKEYAQGTGLLHGGALVSLADTALAMAIKSLVPPHTRFATVELRSQFLAAVTSGTVTAVARVDTVSGRRINGEARVTNASGDVVMVFEAVFRLARTEPSQSPCIYGAQIPPGVPAVSNLFTGVPQSLPGEWVEVLARSGRTRVERIVSRGYGSPEGFWYDQSDVEWVCLLSGKAALAFETPSCQVTLTPGDGLTIPAGCRHRVLWTDPDVDTIWLAVHFPGGREDDA